MDFNNNSDNGLNNEQVTPPVNSNPETGTEVNSTANNDGYAEPKINATPGQSQEPAPQTSYSWMGNAQNTDNYSQQGAYTGAQGAYTGAQGAYTGQQGAYTGAQGAYTGQQNGYRQGAYNSQSAYSQPQQASVPKKVKTPGNGNGKKFWGKLGAALLAGLIFGVAAAGTWYGVNKLLPSDSTVVAGTEFDADAYKAEIEKEILAKVSKSQDTTDDSIVKSVTTESNVTMQVTDVSDVVADVMPSVVSITNTYTYTMNYWGRQLSEQSEASGSGIIIGENDTELLIATNNHVIDGAETLHVLFADGETVEAKVKGADEDNDLAVIAVKFEDIKDSTKDVIEIAKLGDSDALKVGEPAIAIGNALGYGQSVTTGVISALDRQLELEEGQMSEGFIQTDAAINPGNSGGALLNSRGEVVGINSNKIGGTSVEGMGYAIPISRALPIIDDLKTKKTKESVSADEKGYLGISGRAVSTEMVEMYEFPEGVYVYDVFANSGAEAAGLRKGDIITKFDGTKIKSMEALQENLSYYMAGETIELTVARFNDAGTYDEITMQVKLISANEMPAE